MFNGGLGAWIQRCIFTYRFIVLFLLFPFLLSGCATLSTTKEINDVSISEPEQEWLAEETGEGQKEVHKQEENGKTETNNPQYTFDLLFHPEQRILQGNSKIQVWNRAELPTDELYLHLYVNAFSAEYEPPVLAEFMHKTFPQGRAYSETAINQLLVNGEQADFDLDAAILHVPLQSTWEPGSKLELELDFQFIIPEIYHRTGMKQDAYWFGNALPILAVYDNEWHAYPYEAVGEPFFSESADYQVTIRTPAQYELLTSGHFEESKLEGEWLVRRYLAENVREFAFALSADYQQLSMQSKRGKEVSIYFRRASKEQVHKHLQLAVDMLDYMEERVGPYPYEALYVFENEMFVTGMEYPKLVFLSSARLHDPNGYVTVLHEIAHQWFYNIIGNNQRLEPWLDEGLATYFTDEFLYQQQLAEYYNKEAARLKIHSAEYYLQPVYKYGTWSNYWRSNYRNGSFMVLELRQTMGEENFQEFLHAYYERFKYQIVTTTEFKKTAEQFLPEDVEIDSLFEAWGL